MENKLLFKKVKLIAILMFGLGLKYLQAQNAVSSTGGNALGSGGSVSYSVGQIAYTTNTGTNGSAAQGVQQPFEISVITAIEETKDISLSCSAYPNPISDNLTLSINENVKTSHDLSLMSYQLYDINGKLLQSKKITGNQTIIVMRNLVPANYIVKVLQGNKEIKTFKIMKN